MTKRLFSLAVMMILALGAWADDVTTVSSKTLWTFANYGTTGQTSKVYNYTDGGADGTGIYLHSTQTGSEGAYTFVDFNVNSGRAATTSGNFSDDESTAWSSSKVLTCKRGVNTSDSYFLGLGNINASSTTSAANASLAFNYSKAGKLYIIYGATSATAGNFYIRQRKNDETTFTTLYSEAMAGIGYGGVFGTRSDDYKFTQVEATVNLSGSGTVYLGGSQPYCIYAILFVPTTTEVLDEPTVSYKENNSGKAVYTITSADNIKYQLGEGDEVDTQAKTAEISVETKTSLKAWAYNSEKESSKVEVTLLQTPIVETTSGMFDFTTLTTANVGDSHVKLEVGGDAILTVGGTPLYKPTITTAATFAGKFAFQTPSSPNTAVRNDKMFAINSSEGSSYYMVLLGMTAGKCLTITEKQGKATVTVGEKALTFGQPFEIEATDLDSNGNLILKFDLSVGSAQIQKIEISDLKLTTPTISLKGVSDDKTKSIYTITYNSQDVLHYKIGENGEEVTPTVTTPGSYDVEISSSGKLFAWVTREGVDNSDETNASVYAPTVSVENNGIYTFSNASTTTDTPVELDNSTALEIGGQTVYKPNAITANTFNDHFAFSFVSGNDLRLMKRSNMRIAKNKNIYIAINGLKAGKTLTINYTGGTNTETGETDKISFISTSNIEGINSGDAVVSGSVYNIKEDGDILLRALNGNGAMDISSVALNQDIVTMFSFTASAGEHGTVTDSEGNALGNSYAGGTQITISANPESGYKFDYWEVNGVKDTEHTTSTLTLTITTATTVKAYFTEQSAVYGTYDFQTWAKTNISANDQTVIGLTSAGVMTGEFTPSTEGVTVNETMTLNDAFSITGTDAASYKMRRNGNTSGLLLVNTNKAKLTINNLKAGDWFTIITDVADRLAFASDNAAIKKAGSTTTITKDTYVESGVTYVVTDDTSVDIYAKGNVYIYSITISNTEVVSPPVISANGKQVTIVGGSSTNEKSVTTYYTLDGSTPTSSSTKYTGAITINETRIIKAISISESGVTSSVTTQKAKVDGATPSTILNFVNDESLKPLAWGDDHFTMYYYTTDDNSNSHFRYLTNSSIHAKMAWQSGGSNEENASTTDGDGLKKMVDNRVFAINDLAEGDIIYITYTTNGEKLKTSKHSSKGNTVKIGETTVSVGQTEIESGAKIEVSAVDADNNYVMFMPNSKMTITQIAINPVYKITTSVEHGTISVTSPEGSDLSTATFAHGTEVTLQATAESSEWVFSHWVVNGAQSTEAILTLTMDGNKTVEAVFKQKVSANGVPVIIVAGQSNTDGRIKTTETAFPYTLNHTQISYCNGDVNGSYPVVDEGNFVTYGTTPRSDAGESWGYDAIIYNKVQEALGGNTDFYVIKQSKGNTAVNAMSTSGNNQHWWSANPVWLDRNTSANKGGRSLLLALKDNIDKSLKVFDDTNKEYDIKFLMWHQGEADRGKGTEYETQMKAVINYIRNYLVERTGNNKYSNLPVILGGIADVSNEYKAEVETGKQNIAAGDANVYYVPTGTMTLETDFRSDKVHFNATGAEKLATKVWDVISTNKLLDGITLAGTDTPAEDLLKEDVVNKTTTWNFTTTGALTEGQSMNGLYNHRGTVNQKDYGTITLTDGSTIDGTYAATTNAADRKASCTQGLTAGYTGLTYVYSVNVNSKGTFMAVIRPLGIKDANTQQYARLMLNGEELQAVAVTSTDENIQLVGKTTGKGTFAVTCGESWDFIGAKFIKGNSTIEILTTPTIEAGSKLNTIKITPGVSDQSDATVKTYYTIDSSTPSESSLEYTGTEVTLTKDCIVKAVSISSNGSTTYSDSYTFTFEKPTDPVLYDFKAAYESNPEAELGMTDDNKATVYYHRSSDDSDRNGSFNYVTAAPYNSVISVLSTGMTMSKGGLKVSGNRPFAIHGLKLGDVIRLEFSGELYYAKHTSKGNALADISVGDLLENLGEYTISSVDAANNYVVFFPSATTTITQLSINKVLAPYSMTDYYISPDGDDDNNTGVKSSPFKTLKRAQEMVQSKGTVHILPGTYKVTNAEYMDKTNTTWNVIYNLNTANVQYIGEVDSDGKRPVFDFSNVTAEDNKRITGFLLSAKNITIKNIETIGIQVPKISGDDTQSEFFRLNGANGCTLQNIAAHDGNGIGFYIHGKSRDNLIVDCDAYQNVDLINNTGENNDGFGCHVATGYTGNKFLRCRAWNNADDGFDLLKCQAVVTIEECIAYANGMASGIDIKGNGNGIKAGGFGKAAFSASLEIPMHVVKNCIAVRNRKSGFYANHHLGGLQFEGNRAFDNNPDFNMMNRSLESLTETIPENSDPRMEVDGYGHLLSNNIVYRNSDFDKLITYTNPSECTLVGNSFTYQNGEWTNKAYTEDDFVSLAVSGLLKARDATGKLPDAVFDFMKLKDTGETVDAPTVELKSEEDGKATYSVTYPADAELHYKLPNDETEYTKTGGSTDIEVTSNGKLIAWAVKGNNSSTIVQISVLLTGAVVYDFANTTDNINADDNNKKRTLDYGETSASFRYVLNGSDRLRVLTYASTGKFTQGTGLWLDGSDRPFAIEGVKAGDMIRVIHNGTIIDANAEKTGTTIADINGNAFTGDIASGKAIMVKTADADNDYAVLMANSKNLTISMLAINHAIAPQIKKDTEQSGNGKYIYKVRFYEGETLHYTSPDAEGEQTVNYGSDGIATITVTKDGKLNCWTTYGSTESEKVAATIDSSVETATIEVKAGYQTYYAEKALDFSNMNTAELRAYIVMTTSTAASTRSATRGTSASQLELKEVSKVPAQTALVLWAKNASTIEVPYLETAISKIMLVSNTEVATSENLLKKAAKTEIAESDEVIFVPNTKGELSFDYSSFVSRGSIYIEIPASIIDENVKELTLGKTQDDGTVVPMEVTIATLKNVTPVLDTENSNKSKKVYIFNFSSGQKLYYKRAGQDTEFRNASWTEGGTSISNSNNGFMEYYIQEGNTTSRTDAKVVMLVPKATLAKIGSNTSTYQVDFFDGATLYYTLGDEAEQSVDTGSPFNLNVTSTGMLTAYTKLGNETSDTLSIRLYAPTPAIASEGIYDFSEVKNVIGADYTLTSQGYDGTIEVGGITLNKPNAMTAQTLDIYAFTAPTKDKNGNTIESSDWRLLNAGRLRAAKSANNKYFAILNLKKGQYLVITYSGAAINYVSSGTAKLPSGTTLIESGKGYKVQSDGNMLFSIPADTENHCDITYIVFSENEIVFTPGFETVKGKPEQVKLIPGNSSIGANCITYYTLDDTLPTEADSAITKKTTIIAKKSCTLSAITISSTGQKSYLAQYNLEVVDRANRPEVELYSIRDMQSIYRITYDEGSTLHYILEIEGSEHTAGGDTYDLPITKSTKAYIWATKGTAISDTLSTTLFTPTNAPIIKGNYDFAEISFELPSDLPVTLNMDKEREVEGYNLYLPTALTKNTFGDKFAFSELEKSNKIRIRTNRTLAFAKGENMKMGILNLKKGDIVAFDFKGIIQMMNGDVVKEEAASSRTRGVSQEMTSGASYVMQKDGDLLLNIMLSDSTVIINKMYVGEVPGRSASKAIDFITAGEEFETLEFGTQNNVYIRDKDASRLFRWLTNDSKELPIDYKLSTESGEGAITTSGLTAGNRRVAIHNLGAGDKIKLRFSGGGVTFEGHESNGNIVSVDGKRLVPGDSLRTGDVITVDKVNYLYNYVVLKLDSKVSVSGIYINAEEVEKVWMPTIVDKGSNTIQITAGQSSLGNQVTTCYTTDGSEPTRINGTSGPYDEFDVQLLGGGLVTIKAVSYTDGGVYSKVAELTIYADELLGGSGKSNTRSMTGTYDMQGNKVEMMQPGRLYIRDGKVVFFGLQTK